MEMPTTQEELDALIERATKALKAELLTERGKRQESEAKISEINKKLADFEEDHRREKVEKEKRDLEAKGKYDEALKTVEETYKAKLNASEQRIRSLMVDSEIMKYAGRAIRPEQALALIKNDYVFEVTDSGVQVKTPDGKPLIDDKGNIGGIEMATQKWFDANPHFLKPASDGGSGIASGATSAGSQSREWEKLNPTERLAYGHSLSEKKT